MTHNEPLEGLAAVAAKVAPPVTVTTLHLGGVALSEWLILATLIYTILQIGWFVYSKLKITRKPHEPPRN